MADISSTSGTKVQQDIVNKLAVTNDLLNQALWLAYERASAAKK